MRTKIMLEIDDEGNAYDKHGTCVGSLNVNDVEIYEDTLIAAQQKVIAGRDVGIRCPCCTRLAKVYKRPIHSSMVLALKALHRRQVELGSFDAWIHVEDYLTSLGDVKLKTGCHVRDLRYRGLLQKSSGKKEDGQSAGLYKVTPKGQEFIFNKLPVKSHCLTFDGKFIGLTGIDVYYKQCLSKTFDLKALMRNKA